MDHHEEAQKFFQGSCDFILSAATVNDLPPISHPEIAFIGRSNVGKSRLLNALVKRHNLARVSNTPGRTQFLNFFLLREAFYLVDMPGYGYAEAPKTLVAGWQKLIRQYLLGRPTLQRVYVLIDARHGIKDNDVEIMRLLDKSAVSYQLVVTKTDKLKKSYDLEALKNKMKEQIKKHPACYPFIAFTSSETMQGLDELRAYILEIPALISL